jgi:hypothetical protein
VFTTHYRSILPLHSTVGCSTCTSQALIRNFVICMTTNSVPPSLQKIYGTPVAHIHRQHEELRRECCWLYSRVGMHKKRHSRHELSRKTCMSLYLICFEARLREVEMRVQASLQAREHLGCRIAHRAILAIRSHGSRGNSQPRRAVINCPGIRET